MQLLPIRVRHAFKILLALSLRLTTACSDAVTHPSQDQATAPSAVSSFDVYSAFSSLSDADKEAVVTFMGRMTFPEFHDFVAEQASNAATIVGGVAVSNALTNWQSRASQAGVMQAAFPNLAAFWQATGSTPGAITWDAFDSSIRRGLDAKSTLSLTVDTEVSTTFTSNSVMSPDGNSFIVNGNNPSYPMIPADCIDNVASILGAYKTNLPALAAAISAVQGAGGKRPFTFGNGTLPGGSQPILKAGGDKKTGVNLYAYASADGSAVHLATGDLKNPSYLPGSTKTIADCLPYIQNPNKVRFVQPMPPLDDYGYDSN